MRAEIYLHRLTLFGQDAYLNTRQRANHEIDLRSRHLENTLEAGVEYRLTPKFSFSVSGRRALTEYEEDAVFLGTSLQETLNRETAASTCGEAQLTPLTTLCCKGDSFTDEFPFSPERDTDTIRVMPGIEFKPRALIIGSAFVGFRTFTPKDPTALRSSPASSRTSACPTRCSAPTTFGVSYARDVNYSFEPPQPVLRVRQRRAVGAPGARAASRRDRLGRPRVYRSRDLAVGPPIAGAEQPPLDAGEDTTWNYAGSLGYRPGRQTRVGFGASYWERESTPVRSATTTASASGCWLLTGFSYAEHRQLPGGVNYQLLTPNSQGACFVRAG